MAVTRNLSLATEFCPGQNYDIILPTSATEHNIVLDNIATELTDLIVAMRFRPGQISHRVVKFQ